MLLVLEGWLSSFCYAFVSSFTDKDLCIGIVKVVRFHLSLGKATEFV